MARPFYGIHVALAAAAIGGVPCEPFAKHTRLPPVDPGYLAQSKNYWRPPHRAKKKAKPARTHKGSKAAKRASRPRKGKR